MEFLAIVWHWLRARWHSLLGECFGGEHARLVACTASSVGEVRVARMLGRRALGEPEFFWLTVARGSTLWLEQLRYRSPFASAAFASGGPRHANPRKFHCRTSGCRSS